jgi:hypothetical protein
MGVGTAIAIYAAIVGSGSLGWQVFQWLHARRLRVEVHASIGLVGFGPGNVPAVVSITVINSSDYPVRVANVGIDLQDGSERTMNLTTPMPGATVPGVIAPHDSGVGYALKDEVDEQVDVTKPVRVWARLSTGELIHSQARPLMKAG